MLILFLNSFSEDDECELITRLPASPKYAIPEYRLKQWPDGYETKQENISIKRSFMKGLYFNYIHFKPSFLPYFKNSATSVSNVTGNSLDDRGSILSRCR